MNGDRGSGPLNMKLDALQTQGNAQMPNGNVDISGNPTPEPLNHKMDSQDKMSKGDQPSDVEAKELSDEQHQVGRVLRSAYRSIMDETIPDEMLDLLNRLG